MTNWIPHPSTLDRPVYLSLANHIAGAVERGELDPGARLPTHRSLARTLGVSVQTVSRAYEELTRRGLVGGEVGRGTFVRAGAGAGASEPAPPFIPEGRRAGLIDLSILKPVGDRLHVERMKAALSELRETLPPAALFSFRPSVAQRRHREVALDWLRKCGVEASPDQVHITNGATPAMTVALMSAAPPGSLVATEEIGHHTLVPLAKYLGLRLKGIEIDGDGIVPEALAETCRTSAVKALIVTPSAASPTVARVSPARRAALVEIARRHDLVIIENDAWGPLVADRPPPFAALAPERCLYITSFTKCVMPGLRVGYLVAPDVMIPAVANRHLVTNWIATPLIVEIATRWISDGAAWELLEWQRSALAARHALADRVLGALPRRAHPNGLHIWLPLAPPWDEDALVAHARLQGVAVAPGSAFAIEPPADPPAIRISLGSTSAAELRQGLEVIARLVGGAPEPALLAI